jgi:hypothetical protein
MLYPRALNNPAMRASTPNLFSTRKDRVRVLGLCLAAAAE